MLCSRGAVLRVGPKQRPGLVVGSATLLKMRCVFVFVSLRELFRSGVTVGLGSRFIAVSLLGA